MKIDPAVTLAAHGRRAQRWDVIAHRATRYVARVETDDGPVLLKAADDDIITRELAGIRRLGTAGLPVPEILGSGERPQAYVVLRWIDGPGLSSHSSPAAQAEAGRLLRWVHELGGGSPYAGTVATWPEWMAGWLNHAAAWWRASGRADGERIQRLWSWVEESRALLAGRGHDLILFDGRPEHFIVDGDRIAVMIDLSEVRGGDAAMDLGVLAVQDPNLLTGVLAGYSATQAQLDVFAQLVPFYTTLRRLARAEWLQTHGDPAESEEIFTLLDTTPMI